MASNSLALRHWHRVIARWPIDKVRPENVSFQTLMKKRLLKYENPAGAAQSATIKGNEAQVQPVDLKWNEAQEMKQVNALYALLDNRFAKESPMPTSMREPTSSPTHYDEVLAESEKAPTRSLMSKITNKLKGMIRLS